MSDDSERDQIEWEDDLGTPPGADAPRKLLIWTVILVVASAVVWFLFVWVFPWIERNLSDPTI